MRIGCMTTRKSAIRLFTKGKFELRYENADVQSEPYQPPYISLNWGDCAVTEAPQVSPAVTGGGFQV